MADRVVARPAPELPWGETRERIIAILAPLGVRRIALFGSRARGDHHRGSDLDLLVLFEKTPSLLRLVDIEERLEDALGIPVDLVTEGSLSPYIRDSVLRDARVIYG